MNELEQKIIELSKNNENEKIEALLEESLKQDPESIDILFRLVKLELFSPFVDDYSCFLFLEKIIVICKKHQAIASTILTYIKNCRLSNTITDNKIYFMLKHALLWLYEGKDPSLIGASINQIIEFGTCNEPQTIKTIFKKKLENNSNNIEVLFVLALVEAFLPNATHSPIITLLEKILRISNENEAIALIVYAYIKDHSIGIDEMLLHKLKTMHTANHEINSMLKYAISLFYINKDSKQEEQYLKESISLCPNHVLNYVHLAELYLKERRSSEAKILIQAALKNVKKIYSDDVLAVAYDATNINEFINELIKGIHLTSENLKSIETLIQNNNK